MLASNKFSFFPSIPNVDAVEARLRSIHEYHIQRELAVARKATSVCTCCEHLLPIDAPAGSPVNNLGNARCGIDNNYVPASVALGCPLGKFRGGLPQPIDEYNALTQALGEFETKST